MINRQDILAGRNAGDLDKPDQGHPHQARRPVSLISEEADSPGGTVIRVKLLSLEPPRIWRRQLPGVDCRWGRCRFIFDDVERDYDWLVVCNDLPRRRQDGSAGGEEPLNCSPKHTMLTTTEPSSIKTYGRAFTRQFAWVLTSQEPWALPHPGRIFSQAANRWFYGIGKQHEIPYDELLAATPPAKTKDISMVWSGKKQRHTWHRQRFQFMQAIRDALPELEVYGRGVRELDDKAETLDAFRYTIAIENHIGPHHWTEKLSDPFLGYCLPFYFGCPNAGEYFPPESFIPIDIRDVDGALRTIKAAIEQGEYEKRLPAIIEARRRVLEEYNYFAVLAREIEARHQPRERSAKPMVILSRHQIRKRHPLLGLHHLLEKGNNRLRHWLRRGSFGQ
jgi:hypothetical protein